MTALLIALAIVAVVGALDGLAYCGAIEGVYVGPDG